MINEKDVIIGIINSKNDVVGDLNNATKYVDPIVQEKEVTPKREIQIVEPDDGYTGLSKVIVNPYNAITDKKVITKNGIYKASEEDLDGYSEVEVATSGVDINEYFDTSIIVPKGSTNSSSIQKSLKSVPTGVKLNTDCSYMFKDCISLENIPALDTSKVTSMTGLFAGCNKLLTMPKLNTSNAVYMANMFQGCTSLVSIPELNTESVTHMNGMFQICTNLLSVPKLKANSIVRISWIFERCNNLTNVGGFENLGQAYLTTSAANYSDYKLDLSASNKVTHESLINVINNLYDIKTKGCNQQQLVLGSKNIVKLTSEEIAIATNKGWAIS